MIHMQFWEIASCCKWNSLVYSECCDKVKCSCSYHPSKRGRLNNVPQGRNNWTTIPRIQQWKCEADSNFCQRAISFIDAGKSCNRKMLRTVIRRSGIVLTSIRCVGDVLWVSCRRIRADNVIIDANSVSDCSLQFPQDAFRDHIRLNVESRYPNVIMCHLFRCSQCMTSSAQQIQTSHDKISDPSIEITTWTYWSLFLNIE